MKNPAQPLKAMPRSEARNTMIGRALISVFDKTGLAELAQGLKAWNIDILSTGGTAKGLQDAGLAVKDVSDHTGFPEIMDGRVKTLHPKIHGGLLGRRDEAGHSQAMRDNAIDTIDLLVVNLYPFVDVVAKGADFETAIENIDIGGPAMIRGAAKNHEFVTVVTDPADYTRLLEDLKANNGAVSPGLRRDLAAKAFALTSQYDTSIAHWFATQLPAYTSPSPRRGEGSGAPRSGEGVFQLPQTITFTGTLKQPLRYGENPHQSAALYTDGTARPGVSTARQVQGKELSYNNLNDTDAAFELVAEFAEPAVAIIKHANPCGVAVAGNLFDAYHLALRCDPVSAFGGIIALNRPLDAATAAAIIKVFSEVIIAPSIDDDALAVLAKKPNVRVLTTDSMPDPRSARLLVKSIAGGLLVQDSDFGAVTASDLKVVTERHPTPAELADLLFAFRVAKHVKSNAIVYVKDQATVGIGAGQMSRIDSTRIAAQKSAEAAAAAGLKTLLTQGSAVASDAFFPFADGLIAAAEAGATAIIQPGGSIKDQEVIQAANERGLAMVFTGLRHFKH